MLGELVHDQKEFGTNMSSGLEQWGNKNGGERYGLSQIRLKSTQKNESMEALNSPVLFGRRSFCHGQQRDGTEGGLIPESPAVPTYMAATESAKAKIRSMSTPRQRMGFADAYFDFKFPYKSGISLWSSYPFNGEPFSTTSERTRVLEHANMSHCYY